MTYPTDPRSQARQTAEEADAALRWAAKQREAQKAADQAADQAAWREYNERWAIFTRVKDFSRNHGQQAWRRRVERPLAAYGLAFLFRQQVGKGREQRVLIKAATRLWWAGPETAQPLPLLFELRQQAGERKSGVPWDLRAELANRQDPEMADDAVYCGLGLSILHTQTGTFEQACERAKDEWDIPGVFLFVAGDSAAAEDQRVIMADRRGRSEMGLLTIASHRALCHYNFASREPYREEDLGTLYQHYGHEQVLWGMWRLDQELRSADEARRALRPAAAVPARAAEPGCDSGRVRHGVAARAVAARDDAGDRRSW